MPLIRLNSARPPALFLCIILFSQVIKVYELAFKHFQSFAFCLFTSATSKCQDGALVLHSLISLRLNNKNVTPTHCVMHAMQTWIQFEPYLRPVGSTVVN